MTDHITSGISNTHATWLREHAAWLDASMGYVAIPAARMRDAANEIERLRRRETEAAILFAPLAEHDQAVREWLEEIPTPPETGERLDLVPQLRQLQSKAERGVSYGFEQTIWKECADEIERLCGTVKGLCSAPRDQYGTVQRIKNGS